MRSFLSERWKWDFLDLPTAHPPGTHWPRTVKPDTSFMGWCVTLSIWLTEVLWQTRLCKGQAFCNDYLPIFIRLVFAEIHVFKGGKAVRRGEGRKAELPAVGTGVKVDSIQIAARLEWHGLDHQLGRRPSNTQKNNEKGLHFQPFFLLREQPQPEESSNFLL